MNTELNQLLQIRSQKENKQRKIVQNIEREIDKQTKIQHSVEQSISVFKSQKPLLEHSLFNQISDQQITPDNLYEYQNKVKQLGLFSKNINTQHQSIVSYIKNLETSLNQSRQDLLNATKNTKKIRILVEFEQVTIAKNQSRLEDLKADDHASDAWTHSFNI